MTARIRALMRCDLIQQLPSGAGSRVFLNAVWDPDPASANHQWSAEAPVGQVELVITNPAALAILREGSSYWVDLTPIEASEQGESA